ncbi:MAG: cytidylyltransferase domain-containing protein [Methylobacter sp.]
MTMRRRVVASIEARMGASRLPGKVLMNIHGKPAIQRLVDRLRTCRLLDDIVIATTTNKNDDPLAKWCADYDVACFRGSEEDVLNRVVEAHHFMQSDLVVEITGDCPLTDPQIVDLGVETFLAHSVDVVTNCGPSLTWPMGQYVQVFPLELLADVDRTVDDVVVHEHVSLYFYEHPEKYKLIELLSPQRWREPEWRMQLDYREDLDFQNHVYARLEPIYGEFFGIEEVVALLRREPELLVINRDCQEKVAR